MYRKSFFSQARAEKFIHELQAQGIKPTLWSFMDAFNQKMWQVEWDK